MDSATTPASLACIDSNGVSPSPDAPKVCSFKIATAFLSFLDEILVPNEKADVLEPYPDVFEY